MPLTIRHCVIHRIPKRLGGHRAGPEPELSDVESDLPGPVELFLSERITNNLADAYVVEFDPATPSPVPELVQGFFDDPRVLVPMSRGLASHLYTCQGAISPAGLLLVAEIAIDQRLALAILKVEEEDGLQIATRGEAEGHRGFTMVLREDLLLTQKTRVYKVSKFEMIEGAVEGRVLDKQQGPETLVASFFLTKFLGCRFGVRADISTKLVMDTAESFFNTRVADSATRARYEIALIAEMQSQERNIRIRQFAQNHLDLEDRQDFETAMTQAGVSMNVPKDVNLIANRIETIQWVFENGITVFAPTDPARAVNTEMVGDLTKLTIEAKLTKTAGRGRR